MNTLVEDKMNEIYSTIMSKPNQILEIFNNFFGEEKVDMQEFITLEEFKEWILNSPIGDYIPYGTSIYMDFSNYKVLDKTLNNLTEEECKLVLEHFNSSIINRIGNIRFYKGSILVHFPKVRITNEYDKFIDITHLYAKINISFDGTMDGNFGLNRSEYPISQFINNYMHSHIGHIPTGHFTDFLTPCMGSGPIRNTIHNLNIEFNTDTWNLFCLELSKYVEVESLSEGPYHRLEHIGTYNRNIEDTNLYPHFNLPSGYRRTPLFELLREFIPHFIKLKKLKFNYIKESYSIGMSFIDYLVTISNEFIEWYNKEFNKGTYSYSLSKLLGDSILSKFIISNNKLYSRESYNDINSYLRHQGSKICTFKGKDVLLNITDVPGLNEDNESILFKPCIALYILTKILYVVNYEYGRTKQKDSETGRISEKVRYF